MGRLKEALRLLKERDEHARLRADIHARGDRLARGEGRDYDEKSGRLLADPREGAGQSGSGVETTVSYRLSPLAERDLDEMEDEDSLPSRNDYEQALRQWMRGARLRRKRAPTFGFGGILAWTTPGGEVRYLVQEKRHLRNLDVRVVVEQLKRMHRGLPVPERAGRVVLVAPHIRPTENCGRVSGHTVTNRSHFTVATVDHRSW